MERRSHQWTLSVDGERFEVCDRPDEPGTYDFTWLTGPDPEYGFTSRVHGAEPPSAEELKAYAREFLRQVDPDTGHIE
ncbi:hypothetical protein [Streptomyces sp. NPDC002671]